MIKFLDLQQINHRYEAEIREALGGVLDSGWYLLGNAVKRFEREYSDYIGVPCTVGCGNGLDALTLIFRGYVELGRLAPGDEVIVPANTYIASILAITRAGLVPVLVEPSESTLQIDPAEIEKRISPRTRGMMIVHLYGRCAYNEEVARIVEEHGLLLIEDNAQAQGCRYRDPQTGVTCRTGSLGDAAAHSFYPGKNLGALGDAGAVTTRDRALADIIRALANYGSARKYVFDYQGINSRLDEIQAAVLSVKLPYLDADNLHRRRIAEIYRQGIRNPRVTLPDSGEEEGNVYHIFPILCDDRDALQKHLEANGIQTLIHYPIPPHKQKCYHEMSELAFPISESLHSRELSLPISPVLTFEEAERVVAAINDF